MIYSDCESAIKSILNLAMGRKRIRSTTREASMLSAAVLLLQNQDTILRWTKGHPERVDPDADYWSTEMWGNHLSDRAAAGVFWGDIDYQYAGLASNLLSIRSFPTLDALDLSSRLAPRASWLLSNCKGQLRSESILEAVQSARLLKYINTKVTYRTERGLTPKWFKLIDRENSFMEGPACLGDQPRGCLDFFPGESLRQPSVDRQEGR